VRWPERRLGRVTRLRVSNVDKLSRDDGTPVRLCNYVDVYKNEAITNDLDFMQATATPAQIASFRLSVGDTIFTKDSETADDIGVPTYVAETSDDLICGYHLAIATPDRTKVDPRFLFWAMSSGRVRDQWTVLASGVTRVGLRSDDLGKAGIPVPPLDEQRRIADFLDTETARIDQLVAAREQQQPLLEERWRAEIRNELEGRGEGRTPSHVPWLARHPASWRPIRLRHLAHIQRGASPRPIDDPIYFDEAGTHAWVRISDVSASGKFLRRTDQTLSSLGKSRSVALKPGELFVSIAASVGKPVIAAIDCCIHDGFVAIRRPRASVDFLYYVLQLGDCFDGLGKLGTQLNLNSDTIGSLMMALPPEREQVEIAHRLDLARESLTRISASIERQVGILQERRRALITAAVTGQLDVTTARGGRS